VVAKQLVLLPQSAQVERASLRGAAQDAAVADVARGFVATRASARGQRNQDEQRGEERESGPRGRAGSWAVILVS
jgi:hypothetical protein